MIRIPISLLLIAALTRAQGQNGDGKAAVGEAAFLHLKAVEGEGVTYAPGSRATRGVSVLVTDPSGRPADNAIVSFTLPMTGPSGEFDSGTRTEIVTTKGDGRASVWGMRWNRLPGTFEMRVTAIKGQSRADIVVALALSGPPAKSASSSAIGAGGSHKWLWIGIGGATAVAAAVAAGFASKGSSPAGGGSSPSTAAVQIGAPTISLGHP